MSQCIKKGATVYLRNPGRSHVARRGGHIKEGTEGKVITHRKFGDDDFQYLVKFSGHSGPRHCERFQLTRGE
jgi:hypothetical protein